MVIVLVYIMLCIIWGSTWTAIKIGLADAPPMWSAALRFVVAASLMHVLVLINRQKYPAGWREKWRLAWPGIFTYLGSYTFTYVGGQYIGSGMASILFAIFPFIVMVFMLFMVKSEKITWRAVVGVALGFVGVVFIFAEPIKYGSEVLFGMLIFLLSPLCAAFGNVAIKAYLNKAPIFPMVSLQMGLGAILLVSNAFLFEDFSRFEFTTQSVGAMIYLAIFGSIIAFTSYYWLLKRLPLITMAMVALITPITAIILGYWLLDEVLQVQDYIGGALVLAGVALVNIKKGS